jgi:hypothetical protein
MNLDRIKIITSMVAAFFLCCSMSTKCNAPGPTTEVHGIVTDGITGKPIANLAMEVSDLHDPHYFSTNADGTYDLKFTPERLSNYNLSLASSIVNNYLITASIRVMQGTDNIINYMAYPAMNVTVHLINHSDYGQNSFQLTIIDSLGVNNGFVNLLRLNNRNLLIDTMARYQIAQHSHVSFDSFFINSAGLNAKIINQNYILGSKDTLININNP